MIFKRLLCCFCVAASLNFAGCSRRVIAQRDLDQRLIAAIEKERIGDEPVVVRLKDLTEFEWDKVYVFYPYSMRPEDLRRTLGLDWSPETSITHQDWDDLLVFVNRGSVVHYHDHPRKHGDFQGPGGRAGYTPEEAVFEVRFDKQLGWLALQPLRLESPRRGSEVTPPKN